MPLVRNFDLTDVTLSTAAAEAGPVGVSSPAGLLVHRYVFDLSTHTPLAVTDYTIFDPDSAVLPIMFFGAYLRWDLDDTEFDNGELGVGGSPGANNLIQANPVDQASNHLLWGPDPADPGGTSPLIDDLGSPLHPHFARGLSTDVGMPILLKVDASGATANPYSGKVMVYLLFASLA